MAEEQCNLIKNVGGNGVKLRKTVTNTGSQTRATLIHQLRSDVVAFLNSSEFSPCRLYIVTHSSGGTNLVFTLDKYSADRGSIQFSNISGNYAGSSFYMYGISMLETSSTVVNVGISVNGAWGNLTDSSSATDWATVELYY